MNFTKLYYILSFQIAHGSSWAFSTKTNSILLTIPTPLWLQGRNTAAKELKHYQTASLVMALTHHLLISINGSNEGFPVAVTQGKP